MTRNSSGMDGVLSAMSGCRGNTEMPLQGECRNKKTVAGKPQRFFILAIGNYFFTNV